MNLKMFVDKYIYKKVDIDNSFGAQCVDLFRQYNQDVIGAPHTGAVEGAADLYDEYLRLPLEMKYYYKVPVCEGAVLQEGDVVIFNRTSTNKYGHVAIVLYATERNIVVFEQDGLKQDGAKIAVWNYSRVLGVLRAKSV